jgi:membrane-bound ClpP family serine protease
VTSFLLTLLGFVLILIDLIFLPGLVLVAVGSGIILYAVSLTFAEFGPVWATLHLFACLALVPRLVKGSLRRVALKKELRAEEGYVGVADHSHLLGMKGMAFSDLRPAGSVQVELEGRHHLLDCIAEGGFIAKGEAVTILEQRGPSLVVAPWTAQETSS